MPTNVEIKAVVRDWERVKQLAQTLSDVPVEIIEQEDTFFICLQGRLKLRYFSASSGELIAYHREDVVETKASHYLISQTKEPDQLRRALAMALGIAGTVKKRRHLYLCGPTRIHLDEVEGLGTFLELEVVLRPDQSASEGEQVAHKLMGRLGVKPVDLIARGVSGFDNRPPEVDT